MAKLALVVNNQDQSQGEDNLDSQSVFDAATNKTDNPQPKKKPTPAYRMIGEGRIAVGRGVGKMWKARLDNAVATYTNTYEGWQEAYQYYNGNQTKQLTTPRGTFKRGDGTENIVYSNINTVLPAIYSQNPDIACSTEDDADQTFTQVLQRLLNELFRRETALNAKPKIKRASAFGLLTNLGVLKLTFTNKDDSTEIVSQSMQELSDELANAQTPDDVREIEGKMQALEEQLEYRDPMGPKLSVVLPHNLIIDPNAEMPDGSDALWMIERVYLPTEQLNAQYTQQGEGDQQTLVYKPTHQAVFAKADNAQSDNAMGIVLQALGSATNQPTAYTDDERLSYIYSNMTECYYVWDKITRRVMLFSRDDWKWPLWVWDDPSGTTRFFPYFVIAFSFSTGGTVTLGETTYYLDQQDTINNINRQTNRIRESIFNYFVYDTQGIKPDEAAKLVKALRGETKTSQHAFGVKLGDKKLADIFQAIEPPSHDFKDMFDKSQNYDIINRISSVSDALRGTQFKTNTNEAAVNTYQDAVKLMIGAKVDVVEDVVSQIAMALAEMCVQNYSVEDVAGLVGVKNSQGWMQMDLDTFRSTYSIQVVAGSTEKPNSVFKKKEAVQIAQAVGQFAQAAPGATMAIMLKVLQKAFTEIDIQPEDWDMLRQEVAASMQQKTAQQGKQAQQQQQQPQDKQKPKISINWKDMPPDAQIQALMQDGIRADPVSLMHQQTKNQPGGSGAGTAPQPGAKPSAGTRPAPRATAGPKNPITGLSNEQLLAQAPPALKQRLAAAIQSGAMNGQQVKAALMQSGAGANG